MLKPFPRYLHSTGGMLGEGTACDDDEDEGIDFCSSWPSTASAASTIQTNDTKLKLVPSKISIQNILSCILFNL